jgi:hypothetical protein
VRTSKIRKRGFIPIRLQDYVKLHLRANPGTNRDELIEQLRSAMDAHRKGLRCRCGAPIWMIGSSQVGLACFTCITGEAMPDDDYELDLNAE